MHEAALVEALIDQLRDEAQRNSISKIIRVQVGLGVQQLVVPEAFHQAFAMASVGSLLNETELILREVPMKAICGNCSQIYYPDLQDYRCPTCGKADAELIEGQEIILQSVEGEVDEL